MNIWRIHYNYFDWRTYQPAVDSTEESDAESISDSNAKPHMRQLEVPGTKQKIFVPLRRATQPKRTTPAMRMGVLTPSVPKKRSNEETSVNAEAQTSQDTIQPRPESERVASSPKEKKDLRRDDRPYLPDLSRTVYQPWLFHGTPMWAKLQGR